MFKNLLAVVLIIAGVFSFQMANATNYSDFNEERPCLRESIKRLLNMPDDGFFFMVKEVSLNHKLVMAIIVIVPEDKSFEYRFNLKDRILRHIRSSNITDKETLLKELQKRFNLNNIRICNFSTNPVQNPNDELSANTQSILG